jgi:hypothetical protein
MANQNQDSAGNHNYTCPPSTPSSSSQWTYPYSVPTYHPSAYLYEGQAAHLHLPISAVPYSSSATAYTPVLYPSAGYYPSTGYSPSTPWASVEPATSAPRCTGITPLMANFSTASDGMFQNDISRSYSGGPIRTHSGIMPPSALLSPRPQLMTPHVQQLDGVYSNHAQALRPPRVYHPNPVLAPDVQLGLITHDNQSTLDEAGVGEKKEPRFKPTKAQLEALVKTYSENK